jgi:hypothetical protein
MAHEIRSNDSLVLARTAAWHGLGQILPDTVTPAEALRIGRLDWMVEESTSLTACFVGNDGTAERAIVESHKTLRRSDDQSILSTVGADYSVLQNTTLAEIATSLGSQGSARDPILATLERPLQWSHVQRNACNLATLILRSSP